MDENYGIKGCVQRLEQRKQLSFDIGRLERKPDHNSFDVEFSPNSQVLQKTTYTYGGAVYQSTRFEYDGAGRLVRTTEFDSKGVQVAVSDLVHSDGKSSWINRDAAGTVTSRGVDEYNGENLILASSWDGHDIRRTIKTFEYLGDRLSESDSRYYLPDGALYQRWLTDYDSAGRVHRTYGLKADGSPLGDGKYVYEYDDEGRRSKIWTFDEFSDENIASSVKIYEYMNDDQGNWVVRREFNLWRNNSYRSKTTTTRKLTYFM